MKITLNNNKAGRSYQRHLEDGIIKRHTNLSNEITGDYYRNNSFFEEQIDWGMIGWTVAMMGVCGVIYLVAF